MLQPRLLSVTPIAGTKLVLDYETGEHRLFDVTSYVSGRWYGELADAAYFNSVSLLPGGIGIEWPHGQDIAPHELYGRSVPFAADISAA